ncbi:hypothetical protein MFLAVUS_002685 [Mucor flavus]|uniref:Uncharacterized protein n=1 Tax=Mucor flavus TaxID=439312 RepID=A0ABP9YQY8_9FUNG
MHKNRILVPIKTSTSTTDEYDSYYGFKFDTYAYYKIVRGMESNNIDTNKVAQTESSEYRYIPEPENLGHEDIIEREDLVKRCYSLWLKELHNLQKLGS